MLRLSGRKCICLLAVEIVFGKFFRFGLTILVCSWSLIAAFVHKRLLSIQYLWIAVLYCNKPNKNISLRQIVLSKFYIIYVPLSIYHFIIFTYFLIVALSTLQRRRSCKYLNRAAFRSCATFKCLERTCSLRYQWSDDIVYFKRWQTLGLLIWCRGMNLAHWT